MKFIVTLAVGVESEINPTIVVIVGRPNQHVNCKKIDAPFGKCVTDFLLFTFRILGSNLQIAQLLEDSAGKLWSGESVLKAPNLHPGWPKRFAVTSRAVIS